MFVVVLFGLNLLIVCLNLCLHIVCGGKLLYTPHCLLEHIYLYLNVYLFFYIYIYIYLFFCCVWVLVGVVVLWARVCLACYVTKHAVALLNETTIDS